MLARGTPAPLILRLYSNVSLFSSARSARQAMNPIRGSRRPKNGKMPDLREVPSVGCRTSALPLPYSAGRNGNRYGNSLSDPLNAISRQRAARLLRPCSA
jgi:hypothetical protein